MKIITTITTITTAWLLYNYYYYNYFFFHCSCYDRSLYYCTIFATATASTAHWPISQDTAVEYQFQCSRTSLFLSPCRLFTWKSPHLGLVSSPDNSQVPEPRKNKHKNKQTNKNPPSKKSKNEKQKQIYRLDAFHFFMQFKYIFIF